MLEIEKHFFRIGVKDQRDELSQVLPDFSKTFELEFMYRQIEGCVDIQRAKKLNLLWSRYEKLISEGADYSKIDQLIVQLKIEALESFSIIDTTIGYEAEQAEKYKEIDWREGDIMVHVRSQ